jgi:hypothetical protein
MKLEVCVRALFIDIRHADVCLIRLLIGQYRYVTDVLPVHIHPYRR